MIKNNEYYPSMADLNFNNMTVANGVSFNCV